MKELDEILGGEQLSRVVWTSSRMACREMFSVADIQHKSGYVMWKCCWEISAFENVTIMFLFVQDADSALVMYMSQAFCSYRALYTSAKSRKKHTKICNTNVRIQFSCMLSLPSFFFLLSCEY